MQPDQRDHEKAWGDWAVANRKKFGYIAQRPMATIHMYETDWIKLKGSIKLDCSEFVTISKKISGAKDPTGFNFAGFGNSGQMYITLPHLKLANVRTSTIAVFGNSGISHAAWVYEPNGDNPMFVSHGTADGPGFVTYEQFMGRPAKYVHYDYRTGAKLPTNFDQVRLKPNGPIEEVEYAIFDDHLKAEFQICTFLSVNAL